MVFPFRIRLPTIFILLRATDKCTRWIWLFCVYGISLSIWAIVNLEELEGWIKRSLFAHVLDFCRDSSNMIFTNSWVHNASPCMFKLILPGFGNLKGWLSTNLFFFSVLSKQNKANKWSAWLTVKSEGSELSHWSKVNMNS